MTIIINSYQQFDSNAILPLPPSAMTASPIVLSGTTFTATVSSQLSGNPINVFDKNYGNGFTTQPRYNTGTGAYTGTETTGGVAGEWIQLQMTTARTVRRYELSVLLTVAATRSPTSCVLFGSNNGTTWVQVDSETGLSWSTTVVEQKSFVCTNPGSYTFYRLVVPTIVIGGQSNMSVGEIVLFY
jgi:hypothetical protein